MASLDPRSADEEVSAVIFSPAIVLMLAAAAVDPNPTAADLARFPPRRICEEASSFLRAHLDWLDQVIPAVPEWRRDSWHAWRCEAYRRWWLWDAVRVAHEGQLLWLRDVRRKLAPGGWASGMLPPYVVTLEW
jgi:hypothetical protein